MGEYAEMMLDGTLCEGCGSYIGDAGGGGVPRYCSRQCAEDRGAAQPKVRKFTREQKIAMARSMPLGKKRLKWLRLAASDDGGMYPGVHADMAPGVFGALAKMGFVTRYVPHNPAHKDRYVITDSGRAKLDEAGQ